MSVPRTLLALAALALVWAQGCDRTINTTTPPDAQPLSCAECHDSSSLITEKQTAWAESAHGMGEAYMRGTRASCAGCHSGAAFARRIAAGLDPDELTEGDLEPTRQDCRTCHQIHETYSMADFALKTEAPVAFYAVDGATFDGGEGNLCVNCHQPRRDFPEPVGGMVTGISSHWGPHHGPQSSMLLGVAGAGVTGTFSPHYGAVENTCVGCHMQEGRDHHFEPNVGDQEPPPRGTCRSCHPTATDFDYKGVQTVTDSLSVVLGDLLVARGLINENSPDGHPIVTEAPTDEAVALWNWIYVTHEDKSMGVHNPDYAKALLEEGLARIGPPGASPVDREYWSR